MNFQIAYDFTLPKGYVDETGIAPSSRNNETCNSSRGNICYVASQSKTKSRLCKFC